MINLLLDDYCQDCPGLDVGVEKTEYCYGYDNAYRNTDIFCKNRELCAAIKKHLENKEAIDKLKGSTI